MQLREHTHAGKAFMRRLRLTQQASCPYRDNDCAACATQPFDRTLR
jgi:hypothetical protein